MASCFSPSLDGKIALSPQAPYIFADYTWFYIGIGATAGKADYLDFQNLFVDSCGLGTKWRPNFCAGAALLLILANICLGCKYKWVACLLLRLELKSESDCKDLLFFQWIIFYCQEILVQPVLRQPLRAPHLCSPSQGPDASWSLTNILDTVLNLCGNRIEEPSKQKPPRFNHVWVSLNLKMI